MRNYSALLTTSETGEQEENVGNFLGGIIKVVKKGAIIAYLMPIIKWELIIVDM